VNNPTNQAKDPKNKNQKEEKKQYKNKFLQAEEKRIAKSEKQKSEKHLFPVKEFYDEKNKLVDPIQLPYSQLDLIFNSKNLWANFQNPDPRFIKYNLHREKQWHPLIFKQGGYEEEKRKETKKDKGSSASGESSSHRKFYFLFIANLYRV
jgi:hypothetical protein